MSSQHVILNRSSANVTWPFTNNALQIGLKGSPSQHTHYRNEEEIRCHQSFKTSRYEAFKDRNPQRVPGTCQWVLNHSKYQSWRTCPHDDLLWISADPGCGKSVLSKFLVDHELITDGSRSTCYFFFKDNEEQNNIAIALCAVLHQLFTHKPELLRHAIPSWQRNKENLQQETKELWQIFLSAATDSAAGHVVCILDALDECESQGREELIGDLKNFHNSSNSTKHSSLKFLVTSRPYVSIKKDWHGITSGIPTIWLAGEMMNEDISKEINHVIDARVLEISEQNGLSQDLQESLKMKLKGMNNRTYLWLYLVIEQIRDSLKHTWKAYNRILETIPSSVEEAYEKILSKSEKIQESHTLLQIVVGAARPLTLREMDVAFSLAAEKGCKSYADLDCDGVNLETRIRNLCGLFVYVTDSRVQLIHQTAKEFLMQKRPSLPPGLDIRCQSLHEGEPAKALLDKGAMNSYTASQTWKSSIQEEKAEEMMAKICMQYLLFTDFDGTLKKEEIEFVEGPEFDFMDYAAINWPTHFRSAQISEGSLPLLSALTLYETSSWRFQIWFSRYWKNTKPYRVQPNGLTNLHLASMTGHTVVVRKLLTARHAFNLDTGDLNMSTAQHWAAENGHEAVVRLLLENGAGVDVKSSNGRTALNEAAAGGHEAVVRLLLENGAGVNVRDRSGRVALHWMAASGHEAVVRLLLENGAGVDVQGNDGATALYRAAENGYEAVVQLLLENGAGVDFQNKFEGTALHRAAASGHETVMRLLLENGAGVDVQNKFEATALYGAAASGHEAAVRLLLENGAGVDAQDEDGETALHWAVARGHEAVVRLLLENGAGVDVQRKDGVAALHVAAASGHEAVVRLLLENGAGVDVQRKDGETALHWAAASEHEAVVRLLLENGAGVDAQDEDGETALHWAVARGHEAVVRLLLENGAGVDVQRKDGKTALHVAAASGHEAVVRLLLENGAGVDVQRKERGTALHVAAAGGHEAVVRLLLENGAGVDVQREDGTTALHVAVVCGYEAVVRLLLENGAGVGVQRKNGVTALHVAAASGHKAVMRLLESHKPPH